MTFARDLSGISLALFVWVLESLASNLPLYHSNQSDITNLLSRIVVISKLFEVIFQTNVYLMQLKSYARFSWNGIALIAYFAYLLLVTIGIFRKLHNFLMCPMVNLFFIENYGFIGGLSFRDNSQ